MSTNIHLFILAFLITQNVKNNIHDCEDVNAKLPNSNPFIDLREMHRHEWHTLATDFKQHILYIVFQIDNSVDDEVSCVTLHLCSEIFQKCSF